LISKGRSLRIRSKAVTTGSSTKRQDNLLSIGLASLNICLKVQNVSIRPS
jgi:hypothetical protein